MFCLNCFNSSTAVVNSRPHKKQPLVWRRRYCSHCGETFTTHERPSLRDNRTVSLIDGKTRPFNLGKLILSIARAFSHNQHSAEYDSLWLAQTVEDTLSTQPGSLSAHDIVLITHEALKRFDELAAVQYGAQHQLISTAKHRGRPSLVWHEPPTEASPSQ